MKAVVSACVLLGAVLAGCATQKDSSVGAGSAVPKAYEYVIDVPSNIALHRAFNADGKTYLEFLDAARMNPVVTGLDGVALPYSWTQNYVVLDGVYNNLTITTPFGVAHVYAREPAPPAHVAAPVPARALEYEAAAPAAPPALPNDSDGDEIPPTGVAVAPDRISIACEGSFTRSMTAGQADDLVAMARDASLITIGASVPSRSVSQDSRAHANIAQARKFLIDNGVPQHKIRTRSSISHAAKAAQIDFTLAH